MDDWYKINSEDIHTHGGGSLLVAYYQSSPSKALQSVFPEHNWVSWKFQHVPKGYWEDFDNQKCYVEWVRRELGLKSLDMFSKLKMDTVKKYRLQTLANKYGSACAAMKAIYPDHQWDPHKFFW